MPRPRKAQVSLEATPYHHCTSRCVRRAFLCGETYEHRRAWVEDRILKLADVFAIDAPHSQRADWGLRCCRTITMPRR